MITLGGIAVVVAVLGILVFIGLEALPLFKSASLVPEGEVRISTKLAPADAESLRAVGVDEYREYFFTVEPAGLVVFYRVESGDHASDVPVPGLGTATVTASSRSVIGNYLAAGLSDGRVSLMQARFVPQYEGAVLKDLTIDVVDRGAVTFDTTGRPVRQVSYIEQDAQKFVAGLVADDEVSYWWTDAEGVEHRAALRAEAGQRITQVRIGRNGSVLAGTNEGRVYHWELLPELRLTDASRVASAPITALEWMLGGNSWVVAAGDGTLSGWFRAPIAASGGYAAVQAHTFEPQATPVVAIALSGRERSFATVGRDGAMVLRHQTSERVLTELPADGPVSAVVIAPKADSVLTLEGGVLRRFGLVNPHPETSVKTLFGKVWYEGYAEARVRVAVDGAPPTTSSRSSAWCRSSSAPSRARSTRCCSPSRWRCSRRSTRRSSPTRPSASRSSRPSRSWRRCRAS